jgi:hypothetical protein
MGWIRARVRMDFSMVIAQLPRLNLVIRASRPGAGGGGGGGGGGGRVVDGRGGSGRGRSKQNLDSQG